MTTASTGGCLCGNVRYTVVEDALETCYCHCHACQHSAGAPVIAWANYARDAFRYTKGSPAVFESSTSAVREFCQDCGTQLVFRSRINTSTIDINASSLDEPDSVSPECHIWFDERVSWLSYDDGLPRYPGDAPDD